MKLIVDHRKQRQLPESGPWILWRQRPPDGLRLGLVVSTTFCPAPECECRDARIEARKVDDALRSAETADDRLHLEFDGGADGEASGHELLRAAIDIDSGEVLPFEDGWNPDLAEWLQDEIDGDVLDRLHAGWLAAKGLPGIDTHSTRPIERTRTGEMVPWQEVFTMARRDIYVTPDGTFEVVDSHCIAAGCRCEAATVQILQGNEMVAYVRYDCGHSRITSEDPIAIPEATLSTVWSAYRRRYPVAARLAAHSAQVKAVATRVRREASQRTTAKVGRNAPCPCGSGKKYKRCCLRR